MADTNSLAIEKFSLKRGSPHHHGHGRVRKCKHGNGGLKHGHGGGGHGHWRLGHGGNPLSADGEPSADIMHIGRGRGRGGRGHMHGHDVCRGGRFHCGGRGKSPMTTENADIVVGVIDGGKVAKRVTDCYERHHQHGKGPMMKGKHFGRHGRHEEHGRFGGWKTEHGKGPKGDMSHKAHKGNFRLDVLMSADAYTLLADAPGVTTSDVSVTPVDDVMEIRVEKKIRRENESEGDENEGGVQILIRERKFGLFVRRISLPKDAVVEAATWQAVNGVLTVTVPRKEEKIEQDTKNEEETRVNAADIEMNDEQKAVD